MVSEGFDRLRQTAWASMHLISTESHNLNCLRGAAAVEPQILLSGSRANSNGAAAASIVNPLVQRGASMRMYSSELNQGTRTRAPALPESVPQRPDGKNDSLDASFQGSRQRVPPSGAGAGTGIDCTNNISRSGLLRAGIAPVGAVSLHDSGGFRVQQIDPRFATAGTSRILDRGATTGTSRILDRGSLRASPQ